jgi:L-fuculose-phosphate aldolase
MSNKRPISAQLLEVFQSAGRALADAGLVSSNSGNLSLRRGSRIVITRHNAQLANLAEADLVEMPIGVTSHPDASVELAAHQAIYETTNALAIVHAHPPCIIAFTLQIESDSVDLLEGGRIPIVEGESGSRELAKALSETLRVHDTAIVRAHGSFAVGKSLAQACERTLRLEEACLKRTARG